MTSLHARPLAVDKSNPPGQEFFRRRWAEQINTPETYKGARILKAPEDLRVYERLIEETRAQVVLELGVESGGSALWFADRVRSLYPHDQGAYPVVIGVDINTQPTREAIERVGERGVHLVDGDLSNKRVISHVRALVAGRRALVVEDAAHTYDCTSAALRGYWDLVQPGCWLVVEDAMVDDDDLRLADWMPRGVERAINDFISSGAGAYFQRHHLAPYGVTFAPNGWLQRVR